MKFEVESLDGIVRIYLAHLVQIVRGECRGRWLRGLGSVAYDTVSQGILRVIRRQRLS